MAPPPDWSHQIEHGRQQREANFRTEAWSPIPAASRATFEGLQFFPADSRFYFIGSVTRYAEPERLPMVTTTGQTREAERVGWLEFELDGNLHRLQVYRMLDTDHGESEGLFLPFADGTTGSETYPAGRYLELRGPDHGPYVLDFNGAYNPYCAYGEPERYACPRTPEENRLSVSVEAGERGFEVDGDPS
ncbi:MAG: DUF1684 domain-containing protein [Acidobacteriota bacterium]|nr:DUF1684 domain-containing protein [Acidobacteriota bacterium]MDH3786614.1 DUF1684 domain-containing protein [Acidobacteriota bacterium]